MAMLRLNIPGFDDAINVPQWATEETLQEVAKQLGAKRSGINSLDVDAKKAAASTKKLTDSQQALQTAINETVTGAGKLAETLFNTDGSLNSLVPIVDALASGIDKGISGLSGMLAKFGLLGKGASAVSKTLGMFVKVGAEAAVVGFDLLTQLADSFADGFRGAASVGATLEGNFQELSRLTLRTNQGLEDLGGILNNASPALSAFTTSSEGARKVLAVIGNVQQESGKQFARLGFTIDETNETVTDFLNILAQTGQQTMLNNMSEAELAKTAGAYATNLAVLSRLTGQNRKELQQQMREEQMRSNVQALLALKENELTGESLESFRNLQVGLRSFSPQLADAFASISTLGVASAEQEALLAQLGPTGDLIRQFATAFKDGTGDVGDVDVQNILQSVAEGITSDQTLRTALLAPAGGFPAALADVVGEGLAFAQKFIAGDVSLAEIRAQVDEERTGRGELIDSIVDAQFNLAQLSKTLQAAVINNNMVQDIVEGTANLVSGSVELIERVLGGEVTSADIEAFTQGTTADDEQQINTTGASDYDADAAALKGGKMIADMLTSAYNYMFDTEGSEGVQAGSGNVASYNLGTPGIVDFGRRSLAFLHGKEAVIPAPRGTIPVDLGDSLNGFAEELRSLLVDNNAINMTQAQREMATLGVTSRNALDTPSVNNVRSNMVAKLDEMISVLKTIADTQYQGNSMFGKEIRRLGNSMSTDLYR